MKIVWQKMVPELDVSEFSVSLEFYTEILGFKVLYARLDPEFVYLEQEELQFMLIQRGEDWLGGTLERPYGRGINLQMELPDVQPIYERLLKNNTTLHRDIKDEWREAGDMLMGSREFWV